MSENEQKQRGVLRPHLATGQFQFAIHEPSRELQPFVERYWIVRWDLLEPYVQETLPHPSVHLVLERGKAPTAQILGVMRHRFSRLLEGSGSVFGVKFRAGGFYPFFRQPLIKLTDRSISLETVFGQDGAHFKKRHLETAHARARLSKDVQETDIQETIEQTERLLLAHLPLRDETAEFVTQIVNTIREDTSITRVEQLASKLAMYTRKLQRLFRRYVGVGPKWVIERYRLHEAIANLENETQAQARLAQDLGYFDQAPFAKAFKKTIGMSPLLYAQGTKP